MTETWHGTTGGYTNHGCRCDRCRKATTDYHRERRWATGRSRPFDQYLRERYPDPPPHGTETRYTSKWRCRCDLCRQASAQARRRRRAAA